MSRGRDEWGAHARWLAMAGNIQVMRIETYKKLDERLVAHVKGVTRPPTARPVDQSIVSVHEPVELGAIVELDGAGAGAGREAIERTRPTGRGRKPGEAIEILLAGPPPYGDPGQWSNARELEWARASLEWVRETIGPESVIVTAALHRDETSPHVQAVVVPVHKGRLGWTRVRDAAAVRAVEQGTSDPERGRKSKYAALQDDYQARVGRRFGLGRGRVGSEAKHEAIDRAKAVEAREAHARASTAKLQATAQEYRDETGAASDRVVQLEADERKLQCEVATLEAEAHAARERRDRDVAAAAAAREQREREEAIAGGLLGRRSRKGRAILEGFEAQVATLTGDRDEAKRLAREAGELARDAMASAKAEREERERVEASLAAVEASLKAAKGRPAIEWSLGLAAGLRLAGRVLGVVLKRAGFDAGGVPGLGRLVTALDYGDGATVEAIEREDGEPEQPAHGKGRGRSGRTR